MKILLLAFLALSSSLAFSEPPDIRIPDQNIQRIKTTDCVEATGTNDLGGAESFTIHNAKAISQFVALLTSDRYTAVPKSLKPEFKSRSSYKIRFFAKDLPVWEIQIIGDSILDIPQDPFYYMESDRYSENLMAPLLRLR